jgi:hypothetical protein
MSQPTPPPKRLKPWLKTPLELLRHAEGHRLDGSDIDQRIALVGFDNAIEAMISTYLSLNPVQRGGVQLAKEQVQKAQTNFHTLIEFLEWHVGQRGEQMQFERDEFIYFHGLRNHLYHSGNGFTPHSEHVTDIRRAALWAVEMLFDIAPETALAPVVDATRLPPCDDPDSSSLETDFLRAAIETRKTMSALLAQRGEVHPLHDLSSGLHQVNQVDDSAFSFAAFEAAIQAADQIKERIVEGETLGTDDAERVNRVTQELKTLSDGLRARLRDYQLSAVTAALTATCDAVDRDHVAGTVVQATGTGISRTLVGYLEACRATPELGAKTFVVLCDRRAILDQLERLIDEAHAQGGRALSVVVPESSSQLIANLEGHGPRVVIATVQRVQTLAPMSFGEAYVIATLNARGDLGFLRAVFPESTFIHFSSNPPIFSELTDGFRGEVIASYQLQEAIEDGNLLPVEVSSVRAEKVLFYDEPLPLDYLHKIASYIYADLRADTPQSGRAIIVTEDLATLSSVAAELRGMLSSEIDAHRQRIQVFCYGGELGASSLQAFVDASTPSVLVMTKHRLGGGIDFGLDVVRCFVTCRLSPGQCHRLFANMGRRSSAREAGKIFDFADNDWHALF